MNADDDSAARPGGQIVTKRVRRGLGGWWVLALILVPILVAALATLTRHGGIEQELQQDTKAALQSGGIDGAQVSFSGRDGTITLPRGGNSAEAVKLAEQITGVRVVQVKKADAAVPLDLEITGQEG